MEQYRLFDYDNNATNLEKLRYTLQSMLRYIPSEETTYGAHGLFPYDAKFMPQYPRTFIRFLSKKRDTVLDPMCGSGTTLIEAILLGRNALGMDIDPLAKKLTKVCTTPIEDSKLKILERDFINRLNTCKSESCEMKYSFDFIPNYDLWFRKDVLRDIFFIRDMVERYIQDKDLQDLAQIALARIVKDVSNVDPRDIFPEINHDKPINLDADVFESYLRSLKYSIRKIRSFTKDYDRKKSTAAIIGSDARKIDLPDSAVDLIVTSPPYAYAMDYARIHKLVFYSIFGMSNDDILTLSRKYVGTDKVSTKERMEDFSRIEFAQDFIEKMRQERKSRAISIWKYLLDMRDITSECVRVLKSSRFRW